MKLDNQKIELNDDFKLLDIMLDDSINQSSLYSPGPYWAAKTKFATQEIKRYGIKDFRGGSNLIGLSYADHLILDVRRNNNSNLKRRINWWITSIYPLSRICADQVKLTKLYADRSIAYAQEIINLKDRTRKLLNKYCLPYSLLGNCILKVKIGAQELSIHYLNLLEQHDNISSRIKFNSAKSMFEIGGGFGGNAHLLLENYKNIRKVLYLDIPPNLYVGTQYLKSFYGPRVLDYGALRGRDSIEFSSDDSLEIFCIAPWQIEKFKSSVDIFINSHSFVEMPKYVVKNYVDHFNRLPDSVNSAVALCTYDNFDLNTTFHPDELPKFFENRKFDNFEAGTLLNSYRNIYYVFTGKFG